MLETFFDLCVNKFDKPLQPVQMRDLSCQAK